MGNDGCTYTHDHGGFQDKMLLAKYHTQKRDVILL